MKSVIALVAALIGSAYAGVEMSFVLPGSGVNSWNYGDPQTGCQSTEMNVSVQGLTGDFCSPPCDSSQNCPTSLPPGVTAQGECVLDVNGGSNPTYCALICDPSKKGTCGKVAKCQPIQGTGVCTYPVGK